MDLTGASQRHVGTAGGDENSQDTGIPLPGPDHRKTKSERLLWIVEPRFGGPGRLFFQQV